MATNNTTKAKDVIERFEASFQDKKIIPLELELVWLDMAVARYCVELEELDYDSDTHDFNAKIDSYAISTLAAFMKQSYQEREVSKVNKRVSIVGKEISVDGNGNGKVAAREELAYDERKSNLMIDNKKPTAYI